MLSLLCAFDQGFVQKTNSNRIVYITVVYGFRRAHNHSGNVHPDWKKSMWTSWLVGWKTPANCFAIYLLPSPPSLSEIKMVLPRKSGLCYHPPYKMTSFPPSLFFFRLENLWRTFVLSRKKINMADEHVIQALQECMRSEEEGWLDRLLSCLSISVPSLPI